MRKIDSTADARLLTWELRTHSGRRDLLTQMGRELGVLHRLKPDVNALPFLGEETRQPSRAATQRCREALGAIPQATHVLEWEILQITEQTWP